MSKFNRIAVFILACILAAGCASPKSINEIQKDGAKTFAEGKKDENYIAISADELLDKLMKDFSDSRERPSGGSLSQDDVDKIVGDSKDESDTDDGSQEEKTLVSDRDDLKEVLGQMMDETMETYVFDVEGYNVDANLVVQIIGELEREDPIDAICVESVSVGMSGQQCAIQVFYTLPVDELEKVKKETVDLLHDAESQIPVNGKSDYEIVKEVNLYISSIAEYPSSEPYAPLTHTAYGTFHDGSAVCDGYSRATKLMLNDFGIECIIVHGDCIGGGGHAWNMVNLDGSWYQLDVTWNDGGASYDPDAIETYFLVTDSFMQQSRTWDYSQYPASSAVPYSQP